ncbi:unnamed protein product [Sordaria macrospora k-hell]|uniref:WGS project CABT00000000 data, contig 2.44 n=1 Tax=Sordaria macrospora (strain ATCC MYA-333 / DSM 997 / K(L3346) / K-hell) TaxID=771870 RepID=F7W8E6_SORMK|nr:uncharacterized protein SMAC_07300 [Sordaria macrospora k-hell]CCC13791.1 unnamed protein product [Sordaria macrospora k-hell]
MDNETISGRCRKIQQKLKGLLAVLENGSAPVSTTVTAPSVQDAFERFMLWAGNLGALRKPTSKLSLDTRLANSQEVRDYIDREIKNMCEALEDLMNIVNGSKPNREIGSIYSSDSEDDFDTDSDETESSTSYFHGPVDEAGSLLQVTSQGIRSLLKIGILIRQPTSSGTDRFRRACRDSTSIFLDTMDIHHVQDKYPKLGRGAKSERMGKAIAKRRQFIHYCRDHKSNLAAEEIERKDTSHPQIGSQKATTAKQSSKATTFIAKANMMETLQGSGDVLEDEEDAVSHCSVSTTSESLAVLKLPRLADLSPDNDPFECPICYTLQQFRSEQSWRRHAYRDLKTYVCTVGGTECDGKFFDDQTSWFNHELEQHRSSYVCVLCGVSDGRKDTTRSLLRGHIRDVHGEFKPDQLERLEDAGRDMTNSFKTGDCPFCDEWSALAAKRKSPGGISQLEDNLIVSTSRFKKHVAMHLEQLAIFAIPRHELDTGKDEDGSYGSESRVMHSDISAGFTGSFESENQPSHYTEDDQSDRAPSEGEGSIGHAASGTEDLPTTAPEEELDGKIEELNQPLSLLEELNPEAEHRKEKETEYQAQWRRMQDTEHLMKIVMAREKQDEEDRKKAVIYNISQRKEEGEWGEDGVKHDNEDREEWDEEDEEEEAAEGEEGEEGEWDKEEKEVEWEVKEGEGGEEEKKSHAESEGVGRNDALPYSHSDALHYYNIQLTLLDQLNKKRIMMAREEQEEERRKNEEEKGEDEEAGEEEEEHSGASGGRTRHDAGKDENKSQGSDAR